MKFISFKLNVTIFRREVFDENSKDPNNIENKGYFGGNGIRWPGARINPLSGSILTTLLPRLTLVGYKIRPGLMRNKWTNSQDAVCGQPSPGRARTIRFTSYKPFSLLCPDSQRAAYARFRSAFRAYTESTAFFSFFKGHLGLCAFLNLI